MKHVKNNNSTIIIIVVAAIAIGLAVWYFSNAPTKNTNTNPTFKNLTEQEKLNVLEKISASSTPFTNKTYEQKQKIINSIPTTSQTVMPKLSDEEKLQILNQLK